MCLKKFLLLVIITLTISKANSQYLDFIQNQCGTIKNTNYFFDNYQVGSHGFGYDLYHYNKVIDSNWDILGGWDGEYLGFIDDTTGFAVMFYSGGPFFIKKIMGDSVKTLGMMPGFISAQYIINRHTFYFATYDQSTGRFCLGKFSDIQTNKVFLNNSITPKDSTIFDTVKGGPICQSFNEVDLKCNGNDTAIISIRFNVDTISSINVFGREAIKIYPNPASTYIKINSDLQNSNKSLWIYDCLGRQRKALFDVNTDLQTIYIGDLEQGIYMVFVEDNHSTWVYKLIKN